MQFKARVFITVILYTGFIKKCSKQFPKLFFESQESIIIYFISS